MTEPPTSFPWLISEEIPTSESEWGGFGRVLVPFPLDALQSPGVSPLSPPSPIASFDYIEQVDEYLEDAARPFSGPLRAAIINQGSYLTGWITELLCSISQIENSLGGESIRSIAIQGREPAFVQLIEDYLGPAAPVTRLPSAARGVDRRGFGSAVKMTRDFASALSRHPPSPFEASEGPSLLLISLQPNSTRAILPTARELLRRGVSLKFLVARGDHQSLQLLGSHFPVTQLPLWPQGGALLQSPAFLKTAKSVFGTSGLSRLLQRVALPPWVKVQKLAALQRPRAFRQLARAFGTACGLSKALSLEQADGVLYTTHRAMINSLLSEGECASASKKIFFLQGLVPDTPPISQKLEVDVAFAGSLLDRPYLDRCGIHRERQAIIGYGDYADFGRLDRAACQRALISAHPQSAGRPIVVFTSQYRTSMFPDWARRLNLRVFVETARRMTDYFFIIRPHPIRESESEIRGIAAASNVSVSRTLSTPEAIKGADVAVSYWSTTLLEAILLDTPMIQLNATGLPDFLDLSSKMGMDIVRSSSELEARILGLRGDSISEYASKRADMMEELSLDDNESAHARACDRILQELAKV